MKRSKPLRRTGFAPKVPLPIEWPLAIEDRPRQIPVLLRPRAVMAVIDDVVRAVPKDNPVRSEAYRRLVAQLPCRICGRAERSQAAHPNTGKGGGTKTDDRLCFPLCADFPGEPGCHMRFDQGALFDKTTRRVLERAWGADTRQRIELAGLWPEQLPRWSEQIDQPDDEELP